MTRRNRLIGPTDINCWGCVKKIEGLCFRNLVTPFLDIQWFITFISPPSGANGEEKFIMSYGRVPVTFTGGGLNMARPECHPLS
jgi:hypothetical protein